jgi:hypothetical protein
MEKDNKESTDELTKAFQKDIDNIWKLFHQSNTDESPYALIMYGNEESNPELFPAILTKEALNKVSKVYVDKGLMDTMEEANTALRFSVEDFEDSFQYADSMRNLKTATHTLGSFRGKSRWKYLTDAAMKALSDLDKDGLFGKGKERAELLLLIIVIESDDDYFTRSLKELNPPEVSKKILKSLKKKGVYKSCNQLIISPDGQYLYSADSLPSSDDSIDSENELVCYSLKGTNIVRQWRYTFPSFGDSIRDMVMTSQGKLWVLRQRYSGSGRSSNANTLIQQFSPDKNKPVIEKQFSLESRAIAVFNKASHIALLTQNEIYIFNKNLGLLKIIDLEEQGFNFMFINKKELFVTTAKGLLKVSIKGKVDTTSIMEEIFYLGTDSEEKQLALSRPFDIERKGVKRIDFPVHLYDIKTLEHLKDIHISDHQLGNPVLSPNGKYLACIANRLHGNRKSLAVFEISTGELLYQSDEVLFINSFSFLSDSQTVVLSDSGIMEKEPIKFIGIKV